jgi:hypothetical protein
MQNRPEDLSNLNPESGVHSVLKSTRGAMTGSFGINLWLVEQGARQPRLRSLPTKKQPNPRISVVDPGIIQW